MSKTLLCVIIVVLVAILFYQSQCNAPKSDDGAAKRHTIDSTIEATRARYVDSIASLAKQVHINDSARNAQIVAYNNAAHSLEDKDQTIQYWRSRYRIAREGRDTEVVFIACDSISAKYAVIRVEAEWWHRVADSLQLNGTQRREIDSAALRGKDSTITSLFASVKVIQGQRDTAVIERDSAVKKAKRSKWLWFGLGAVAGGAAGRASK